jgi:outer membrane protein
MSQDHAARTVVSALVGLVTLGLAPASGQEAPTPPQDADFVYIDSQEILQQAPGASEAQQTWSREIEQYRSEVQALAAEIDSLRQSLESQRDMLNEEATQRREQEIQQKQEELSRRARQLEQQAARRREELLGPILQRVGTVIEQIRSENGYDMVFDISSTGLRAAAPRLDITDLVLRRLQERGAAADTSSGGSGP